MKSDLSNVKVGDSIWTVQDGWTEVINTEGGYNFPIITKKEKYTLDGKYFLDSEHPSAFLTNPFEGYRVDEAFIKEAYQSACSDWKAKIKDKFPEVFKVKYKENVWQTPLNNYEGRCHLLITDFKNNKGYGVNFEGYWIDGLDCKDWTTDVRDSTEAEVKEALINEAKKRGFREGVNVGNFNGIQKELVHSNSFALNGNLFFMGGTCIFKNGTWAKIIQQPIELTLEEIAEKFNVDVKLLKIKK